MLDLQGWRHPKGATRVYSCTIFFLFFSASAFFKSSRQKFVFLFLCLFVCWLLYFMSLDELFSHSYLALANAGVVRYSILPISIITILVLLVLTANTSSSNPLLRQLHDHSIWFKDCYPLAQLASFHSVSKKYAWLIHELCSFVEIKDNPGDPLLSARLLRRSMALIGPDQ